MIATHDASSAASPLPSPCAAARPLRIAIIGCGHIARLVYLPILLNHVCHGEVTVAALCDVRREAAGALAAGGSGFPDARIYPDAREMLRRESLDAALVLTSETQNTATARLVQAAGVAVYLEKPPAQDLQELASMTEAEKRGEGLVYAAFNRRHVPLFRDIDRPASLLARVRGVLARTDRAFDTFLFTGIHLVDSAQYFARSGLVDWMIHCERNGTARWRLSGRLECGASCELDFIPAGPRLEEHLILEYRDGSVRELHFPDPDPASAAEVRLVERRGDTVERDVMSPREGDALDRMGYAPAFGRFVDHLRRGDLAGSPHRLASCVRDTEVLADMQACLRNRQGATLAGAA
ncbi:hypothetical protein OPIT5_10420 [Opitutaceae bacterium TAV5]|nr:hypothetical protein OPIT5_10420 [Opitutaceae bacterium TAV5]